MKKILCVFLSLVMLVSVATVAFAAEDEDQRELSEILAEKNIDEAFINAFNGKTLDFPAEFKNNANYYSGGSYNVKNIIKSGAISKVEFLGLNLGQIYRKNVKDAFIDWGQMSVSKTNVGTLWGEMNTFIASYLVKKYTRDEKLCTPKNATAIANFIGRLINPNFQDTTINYNTSHVTRKTFCQDVSNASGLTDAIANGWLTLKTVDGKTVYEPKKDVNYHPLLISALGVPIYNKDGSGGAMELFEYFTTPSQEYLNPSELGGYIVKSVIENAISEGPIQYLLNVIKRFADGYTVDLYNAVSALLVGKVNAGFVTNNALYDDDFDVLLNTLFNDNKANDTSKMQFVPFPTFYFAKANDTTDQFMLLMTYTNLLGKHQKNLSVVSKLKTIIDNNSELSSVDKRCTKIMVDGMFSGDLSALANGMSEISKENFERVPNTWGWNFKNFFARFWKTIANFMDGIFRTLKNGINLDLFD